MIKFYKKFIRTYLSDARNELLTLELEWLRCYYLYCEHVYTVEDVRNDLKYFTDDEDIKLYTVTKQHANIDAANLINEALDSVYENGMHEDWDEIIKQDVTEEDVQRVQAVFDELFSKGGDQNITYYADKEIEIDELE